MKENKIVYQFTEDHIVLQKKIEAGTDGDHIVTLKYYPPTKFKTGKWWLEVDLGGFYNECFHENEESARWAYDLINVNFIASVVVWHKMKNDANEFRRKTLDIFTRQVFNGRDHENR